MVQIHRSPHSLLIFCFPFNISINDQVWECPEHVIEFPANVGFSIAGHQYTHQTLRSSGRPQFVPEWTFKLNHEMIASGENLTYFEPEYPKLTVLCYAALACICLALVWCCRRYKKANHQKTSVNVVQTLELGERAGVQHILPPTTALEEPTVNKPPQRPKILPRAAVQPLPAVVNTLRTNKWF